MTSTPNPIAGPPIWRRMLRSRSRLPMPARIVVWLLGVPAVLILALYARLLFGPLDISFLKAQVESNVVAGLPANTDVSIGGLALSLGSRLQPVLRLSPIRFTDHNSGAGITADALEIGFSPVMAVIGQPGAVVTLVKPHLQVVQDLLGPRLARFETETDKKSGQTVVRILSGSAAQPVIGIGSGGLSVQGRSGSGQSVQALGMRSDNDWLIYNVNAAEKSLSDFLVQARQGRFSRLRVRGGDIQMLDPVYGLIRNVRDLSFAVTPAFGERPTTGSFAATIGPYRTEGTFERRMDKDGKPVLTTRVKNIDYAGIVPFIDDNDSILAVQGAGRLETVFHFDGAGGQVTSGEMKIDLSGTKLRMQSDLFPIVRGKADLLWNPQKALFTLPPATLVVGKSSATVSGSFVLGFDDKFGPVVSMAVKAQDISLTPYDMLPPKTPFSSLVLNGWSAPLYGAVGIDKLVLKKPGVEIRGKGRFDLLRKGAGISLELGGEGASADDLKRLWPFFVADKGRSWFVDNIVEGRVKSATARFDFPVGTLALDGQQLPWHKGSVSIDLIGTDVQLAPMANLPPINTKTQVGFKMRDGNIDVNLGAGDIVTAQGPVGFANARFGLDITDPKATGYAIAGDLKGKLKSLVALARTGAPDALEKLKLPVAPKSLSGDVSAQVSAKAVFDDNDKMQSLDYAATGHVSAFAIADAIDGHTLGKGDFDFALSPDGYHIGGTADLDGVPLVAAVNGKPDAEEGPIVATTIDAANLDRFGFDASQFLSGSVGVAVTPLPDGAMDVSVDLKNAGLTVKDLGLSKPVGTPGTLDARVVRDGTRFDLSQVKLGFGNVKLDGKLAFDTQKGLISADFSDFALGPGDKAELSVSPTEEGISVKVRGDQLDLKPILARYFALDKVSTGGPQATAVKQTIIADVQLKRAVGFYQVTAYNFDLKLNLRGQDLRTVSLQAQFAEGNNVSITTNQVAGGQVMTAAVNQAGTLLRFLNVYPRLLGGTGSLVLRTDSKTGVGKGEIRLKDFSIVDEQKVAEILGNHKDSRALIAKQNRVNFNDATASFVRRSDRIEVQDAVLDGGEIGGTLRGFVYTKKRQYDLTGTYVPLFALNSVFQKLPILGPLLGGRKGEGLVGVTFAVRGSLDDPKFVINPASILLPGVFRALTEFRAKEAPREPAPAEGQ